MKPDAAHLADVIFIGSRHANTLAVRDVSEQYEHCCLLWSAGDHGRVPRSAELPSERLAAELRRKIESGELGPGDQLPSVTELSETYSVSRATVSKALRVLVDEGLVVTRHGWGTFVTE